MARKQSLVSVPTNLTELNARIALVGSLTRELEVERAVEAEAVAKIKAASLLTQGPLAERIARELSGIEKFATANRTSLLAEGMKSVSLSSGRIGWRMTPLRVSFVKKGAEKALAFLKANRMKKYRGHRDQQGSTPCRPAGRRRCQLQAARRVLRRAECRAHSCGSDR